MNEKTKVIIQRGVVFALFAVALLIVSILFKPTFELNDDGTIRSILSGNGSLGSTPNSHAIFIGFPLTVLLKTLYSINNSIPWYGIWNLLIILFAEICIVQFLITKERKKVVEKLLLLGSVSVLFIGFFVLEQWTIMAGILCGIGLLITVTTDQIVVPIIFYMLCFAEREDVFYMLSPFILITVLYRALDKRITIKNFKPKLVGLITIVVTIIVVITAVKIVDNCFYKEKGWKEYSEFNASRSKVYDLSDFILADKGKYQKELEKKIDNNLFDPIRFREPVLDKKINAKTMKIIEGEVKRVNDEKELWDRIKAPAKKMLKSPAIHMMGLVLIGLLILIVLISLKNKDRLVKIKNIVCVALMILITIAIALYLCYVHRPENRVFASLIVAQFLMVVGIFTKSAKENSSKAEGVIGISLLLLVLIATCNLACLRVCENINANKAIYSEKKITDYAKNDKNTMFLLNIESTFNSTKNVFDEKQESPNLVSDGGWLSKSPLMNKVIRKYKCEDTGELLYNRESKYIVDKRINYGWLEKYLKNRFGKATLKEVDRIKSNDREWRVLKVYK